MDKERILLWGAGERTRSVLKSVDKNKFEIIGIIDNNQQIQGTKFEGIEIYGKEILDKCKFERVVLCLGEKGMAAVRRQLVSEGYDISKAEDSLFFMKDAVLEYYKDETDEEMREIISYLKVHSLQAFNYEFVEKYNCMEVMCEYDDNAKMWFVWENGKKMYMKASLDTEEKVKKYYRGICMEQDEKSPHRYFVEGYEVKEDSIVIDAGVAEGNFALSVIDKVKKIYLIECDEEWIEAIKCTFKEYADKVVIVDKLLSDVCDNNSITIDEIVKGEKIDYIKMDIEGFEVLALNGAVETLKQENIKLNICCYHNEDDELKIKDIMEKSGLKVKTSEGYMCYFYSEEGVVYQERVHKLVRGLVRGYK